MNQKVKFDLQKVKQLQQLHNINSQTIRNWKRSGLMPKPETYKPRKRVKPKTKEIILSKLNKKWIAFRSLSVYSQLIIDVKAGKQRMSCRHVKPVHHESWQLLANLRYETRTLHRYCGICSAPQGSLVP